MNLNPFSDIRPGDIVCCRSENWMGRLIRWVTDSDINHVALYIGNNLLIESTIHYGVRILPLAQYTSDPSVQVSVVRINKHINTQNVVDYSFFFFGREYDLFGQIGILTMNLCRKAGISWVVFWGKNKAVDDKRLWCSEFIGELFAIENVKFADIHTSYLSPKDIYNSSEVTKVY